MNRNIRISFTLKEPYIYGVCDTSGIYYLKIYNIRALQLHSYNKYTNNKPSINVQVMKYITI